MFDLELPFEIADVLAEDGAITRVGRDIDPTGARVVDAAGMIVMPGLINAHTHSNQSIEKGLCDALPLDAWMVVASYGGAGATLRPEDLYLSTMVGAIEMVSTGTTPSSTARAATSAGSTRAWTRSCSRTGTSECARTSPRSTATSSSSIRFRCR